MDLNDEIFINAPQDVVYAGLNDPDILKQCIPGCEELIKHSDTELEAKVVLRVGPVKAKFGGNVVLDPSKAPAGFSLSGEGNGGLAGFAKGGADVELEAQDGGTLMRYDVDVNVGGKIAGVGQRLLEMVSRTLTQQALDRLAKVIVERAG